MGNPDPMHRRGIIGFFFACALLMTLVIVAAGTARAQSEADKSAAIRAAEQAYDAGMAALDAGNCAVALRNFQASLTIIRQNPFLTKLKAGVQLESGMLGNAAVAQSCLGHDADALRGNMEAYALDRTIDDVQAEALDLGNMASDQLGLHRYADARKTAQQALVLANALNDGTLEADDFGTLSAIDTSTRDYAAALQNSQRALALHTSLGLSDCRADDLQTDGLIENALGHYPLALQSEHAALALYRTLLDRTGESSALRDIAMIGRDRRTGHRGTPKVSGSKVCVDYRIPGASPSPSPTPSNKPPRIRNHATTGR